LLLKALRDQPTGGADQLVQAARRYWNGYVGPADRGRGFRHTGAVMLARLYGKSPVEYLQDEPSRLRARVVGERVLVEGIDDFDTLADIVRESVEFGAH
ncbi:MAG TPA: hypothetical protein VGZ68_03455, partial [Acidimicrobiales bacterium]|nr:hypothetical protein [Acidimicrobiales bacterium]